MGKTTAEKLKKAGIETVNELAILRVEDLTSLDINHSHAEKIIENAKKIVNPRLIEHDIKKASKYLVYAFEQSEYYDEDNISESYDKWYSNVLKSNK